ncbi:MAG TPA: hypothetical protein VGI95_09835 [Caulobacteraceae bacterium]|jgi:hypothetical protein
MNITRRSAVLATGAAALTAGAGPALAGPYAWAARHGMSSADYQAAFDSHASQGFRLVHVDGYEVNGAPTFAAIWSKAPGPGFIAHHNMSPGQYQQMFDQLGAQGYRLWKVSAYTGAGQPLYAAIWLQGPGPAYVAHHGMSAADYQSAFNQLTGSGYRLTWVSGCGVGGAAQYAAIWEKSPAPAWLAHHGMTSAQYQDAFNAATAKGFRLQHVSGYAVADVPYFAAIFAQGGAGPWQAKHGMSAADYQANFDTFAHQDLQLADVSGYAVGGQAYYAALWTAA